NELADCFSADTLPSLKRRGGCGINKKARSLRSAADGVVRSAKSSGLKSVAELTSPSARTKVASRHFLDRVSTRPFHDETMHRDARGIVDVIADDDSVLADVAHFGQYSQIYRCDAVRVANKTVPGGRKHAVRKAGRSIV